MSGIDTTTLDAPLGAEHPAPTRLAALGGPLASGVVVIGCMAASRVLGLLRESALAASFGTGPQVDAFFVAQTVPFTVFSLVSTSASIAFVPSYVRLLQQRNEGAARHGASAVFTVAALGGLLAAALGVLLRDPLIALVAPGLLPSTAAIADRLTIVLMPLIPLLLCAELLAGQLQARHRFLLISVVGVPENIVLVAAALAASKFGGITLVAIALVLVTMLRFAIYVPGIRALRLYPSFVLDWKDPTLRACLAMVLPALIASSGSQVAVIVNRALGAGLASGTISALNYASRLFLLPLNVYSLAILTITYPAIVRAASGAAPHALCEAYSRSLRLLVFGLAPLVCGLVLLRDPIVNLAFHHGAFGAESMAETARLLGVYALAIVPLAVVDLGNRVLFAVGRHHQALIVGAMLVVGNVVLGLPFRAAFGAPGLPAGTAVATLLAAVTQGCLLRPLLRASVWKPLVRMGRKVAMATLAMAAVLLLSLRALPSFHTFPSLLLGTGGVVGAGVVVYMVVAIGVGLEEAEIVVRAAWTGFVRRLPFEGRAMLSLPVIANAWWARRAAAATYLAAAALLAAIGGVIVGLGGGFVLLGVVAGIAITILYARQPTLMLYSLPLAILLSPRLRLGSLGLRAVDLRAEDALALVIPLVLLWHYGRKQQPPSAIPTAERFLAGYVIAATAATVMRLLTAPSASVAISAAYLLKEVEFILFYLYFRTFAAPRTLLRLTGFLLTISMVLIVESVVLHLPDSLLAGHFAVEALGVDGGTLTPGMDSTWLTQQFYALGPFIFAQFGAVDYFELGGPLAVLTALTAAVEAFGPARRSRLFGIAKWLLLVGAFISGSRASLFGAALAVAICALSSRQLVRQMRWAVPVVALAAGGAVLGIHVPGLAGLANRLSDVLTPVGGSSLDPAYSDRFFRQLPGILQPFLADPLLGGGKGVYIGGTDQGLVRLLGETGLIGFVLFMSFLALTFRSAWRAMRTTGAPRDIRVAGAIAVLAIIAALGTSIFDAFLYVERPAATFWLLLGMAMAIVPQSAPSRSSRPRPDRGPRFARLAAGRLEDGRMDLGSSRTGMAVEATSGPRDMIEPR